MLPKRPRITAPFLGAVIRVLFSLFKGLLTLVVLIYTIQVLRVTVAKLDARPKHCPPYTFEL